MEDIRTIINALLKRKKVIIISIITIVSLTLIFKLATTYALLSVSASGEGISSSKITVYTSSDSANRKATGVGLQIVKRDTKSIIVASSNTVKTQTQVSIPWYGYATTSVILRSDKNADKIEYANNFKEGCATYNSITKKLTGFECSNSAFLQPYQGSNGRDQGQTLSVSYDIAQPYLGGVIAITNGTDADHPITVLDKTGKYATYNIPDEIDEDNISSLKLFSHTSSSTDGRFVIVDGNTGDVYLGTPQETMRSVDYIRHAAPNNYNPDFQKTLCALTGDIVYCYRAEYAIGDIDRSINPPVDTMTTYSYQNEESSTLELDENLLTDEFYATSNGKLYGKRFKKLYTFNIIGETIVSKELAQNIDSGVAGDDFYYVQQGGLYKISDNNPDAHQVFSSSNITLKQAYISDEKIFMLGSITGGKSTTYAYKLNDENNTNPGTRIIDLFPTASDKLSGVTNQDMIGNELFITIPIALNKNARTAAEMVDQDKLEASKQKITNELGILGIDTTAVKVTYYY